MTNAFRNPALQRLHAMSQGQTSQWRRVHFKTNELWSCPQDEAPEIWFPEEGVWVLEQRLNTQWIEVALIDGSGGLLLPPASEGRVRALLDGHGYALPAAAVASVSHDVLLQTQQHLVQQMAVWTYCSQHHDLTQALADRICWMLQACAIPNMGWPPNGLPGCAQWDAGQTARAVDALQQAGAVGMRGALVQVLDETVLRRMACGCHASRAATASATLMPSTPADRMPPA